MSYVLGIDIYNGNSDYYDFNAAARDGIGYVIHKASQGWINGPGGWMDWKMVGALSRARSAGHVIGGYHWMLKGNGAAQAQNFVASLQRLGGPEGMLAAIDFERNDWNTDLNPDTATLTDFIIEWERLTNGQPILIYNAYWYHVGILNAGAGPWSNHPLWVASYLPNGPTPANALAQQVTPGYFYPFGGWQQYTIRQYSSTAYVSGQQSDVDIFYGTRDDLLALTRPGGQPLPVPVIVKGFTVDAEAKARFDAIDKRLNDLGSALIYLTQGVAPGKPNPYGLSGSHDVMARLNAVEADVKAVKSHVGA